jgi:hypothetical protein
VSGRNQFSKVENILALTTVITSQRRYQEKSRELAKLLLRMMCLRKKS